MLRFWSGYRETSKERWVRKLGLRYSNRKVGGIRFIRVGAYQVSFCVSTK